MNQQAQSLNASNLSGILVTLHVGDAQVLYIMVAADGTINRMGSSSEANAERDLFIGKASGDLFTELRRCVSRELLQWLGEFSDPHPQGKSCRLTIGFRQDDGTELTSRWQYGIDSQGPPPEVSDFVRAALYVTQPWYEEQQQLARRQHDRTSRPLSASPPFLCPRCTAVLQPWIEGMQQQTCPLCGERVIR